MTRSKPDRGAGKSVESLSDDRILDLLSAPRRRYVLGLLSRRGEAIRFAELARTIADWETDDDDGSIPGAIRYRVQIELYHAHLPKLAEAGLLEFDQSNYRIRPTEDARSVEIASESLLPSQQRVHRRT